MKSVQDEINTNYKKTEELQVKTYRMQIKNDLFNSLTPPVKTKLINKPKFLSAKLPARLFLKENSNGRKKSTLH